MRMKKVVTLVLSLSCLILSSLSCASMNIDKAIVVFKSDASPREDIEISNVGDETLYIQVEVFEVTDPGTENEQRIKVTNPDDIGLLVTPNKIIIPPHGHKLVRLVNLKPAVVNDRIYRIKFTPIVGPLKASSTGVKIIVAYGVLVIVQPGEPDPQLEVIRTDTQLWVKNNGNTNALFQDGTQCPEDENEACQTLKSKRVYAGNEWVTELPSNQAVNYYVTIGDRTKKKTYP